MAHDFVDKAIGSVVAIAMVPLLLTFIDEANVTGTTSLILNLIPFVFAAAILYYVWKGHK